MGSGQGNFQGYGKKVWHGGAQKDVALEEEQLALWQADRDAWGRDQPVTAWLASHLSLMPVCEPRLPTATTDGRYIMFNAIWSAGLDAETRQFLQAHLAWHCVAGHLRLSRDWEKRRWHLACDHEVNALLLLLGIPLPDDAVLFPACIGQPLPAVYDWLDHFPDLEREMSLDMTPTSWDTLPASVTGAVDDTPHPADETLLRRWQGRALEVAKRHLGTPNLPSHVAALLVTRQ
ncbi:DUF2201 family putative metallopeptidase [Halomonas sp. MA07-2]|uniref:DUF2201 family putative metallopeptidase n=1 Tax=Halomonas sp. MA07-2 TaxID=3440841 RepID=UPI003EED6104